MVLLLSTLLAFAVWAVRNLSQNYTVSLSVPVLAQCYGLEGYGTHSTENCIVVARVTATGFDIVQNKNRDHTDPCCVLFRPEDLHPHPSGSFYVTSRELANYSKDIFGESAKVEYFDQDTLFFHFARQANKKVPVILEADVKLHPQYQFSSPITLSPDSILVYADASRLEFVNAVYAEPLKESGLSISEVGTLALRPIEGVRFSQPDVQYSIRIQRCVEMEFVLKLHLINVPEGKILYKSCDEVRMVANCTFPLSQGVENDLLVYADCEKALQKNGGSTFIRLAKQPSWLLSYRFEPQIVYISEN